MVADKFEPLNVFEFVQGDTPVLVSMPHSGLKVTPQLATCLSDKARTLPDTDWYIPELYSFLSDVGVACIRANYSRYVIDLNRPLDDAPMYQSKTTGLFPQVLFDESSVFHSDKRPDTQHQQMCKEVLWKGYHEKIAQELERLKARFGFAILFDAHSIAARVPMLFDGQLPDFNFGNNDGATCADNILQALSRIISVSDYSVACNARFKGGYITRSFGNPDNGVHAIQLELSQATYLQTTSLQTTSLQTTSLQTTSSGYQIDSARLQRLQPRLLELVETLLKAQPSQ